MKRQLLHKILLILFLLPVYAWAQRGSMSNEDITGMWKGALYNDTTQKYLTYEIAISEEKGKLSGYSYTIFDIDGKKEIGVKKIKIRWKNDELVLEDVVLISNNYSAPPPRGVRQTSMVNLSRNDTVLSLNGTWRTNPTREYSSYTGRMKLQREADFRPVALYKKLEELKLDHDLSFVKMQTAPQPDVAVAKTTRDVQPVAEITSVPKSDPDMIEEPPVVIREKIAPVVATLLPVQKINRSVGANIKRSTVANRIKDIVISPPPKYTEPVAVATPVKPPPDLAVVEPKKETPVAKPVVEKKAPPVAKVEEKPKAVPLEKPKAPPVVVVKEAPAKQKPPVTTTPPVAIVKEPVKETRKAAETITPPVKTEVAKVEIPVKKDPPAVVATTGAQAAEKVGERKMAAMQSVFFQSDSLIFTLYDNGEVDGDTVSVLMNGNIIFSRQGLTTRANSKTIYTNNESSDSIMLVMYAENLGSIPPNTGLLMVQDGEATYYVRFTADLQNNAAILLRRKKKE